MTSNKNPIPFDSAKPSEWKGIRLGTSAGTTRGSGTSEFEMIAHLIADTFEAEGRPEADRTQEHRRIHTTVAELCAAFPI